MRRAIPALVWLSSGAVLATVASHVRDWFVMTDELLYERLAISVVRAHTAIPQVHGTTIDNINQLYPLVLAPVFAIGNVGSDVQHAHILNAFVMTFAAVPAGLLAQRLTGSRALSFVSAALTVVVPWMVLSSFVLTEVVAYPAFAWAIFAFYVAITSPSDRNDAFAVVALVVAVGARTQFAALAVPLAVGVIVHNEGRRHRVLIGALVAGVVAALALVVAGHSPLGTYSTTVHGNLFPLSFFPGLLTHLGAVALGLGLLPVIVGGAWLLGNARRNPFATLALATIVVVTIEVASYDARFGAGVVRDRYVFYLVPVFAVAFTAGLAERVRPWLLLIPMAVVAAGLLLAPLPLFDKFNVDTPVSTLDNYLRDQLGGLTGARLLLAGAAIVIGLLLFEAQLLLKPRIVVPVVAVLALLGATARTAYAFDRLFRTNGTAGRPLTVDPGREQSWIDRAVGSGSHVTQIPFPVITGDYFSSAAYWWDAEFWNKSVDRTAGVPTVFEWTPSTFPKLALRFDKRGRANISPPGYVLQAVGDTRFHIVGTVILNNRSTFLVRPEEPWHADWSSTGLFNDGWTRPGVTAHVLVYPYPGQTQPVKRSLSVYVFAPYGVKARPLSLGSTRGSASTNQVTLTTDVCVHPDRPTSVPLKVSGWSSIPGDTTNTLSARRPRIGGVEVSRIYVSGSYTPGC